jgi:hypothetical protein
MTQESVIQHVFPALFLSFSHVIHLDPDISYWLSELRFIAKVMETAGQNFRTFLGFAASLLREKMRKTF